MTTVEDFITLLQEEMGLPVTAADAGRRLDQLDGWDSLHLLTLLTVLERRTGRSVALPDVLTATTLNDIYAAVAG